MPTTLVACTGRLGGNAFWSSSAPPARSRRPAASSRPAWLGLIARDGAVAFLLEASHPDDPAVPDDLLAGDLWLDDRKAGSGVSVQEGAYAFSPRGSDLAFLARWRFREGEGELLVGGRVLALLSTGKEPGEAMGDLSPPEIVGGLPARRAAGRGPALGRSPR